MPSLLLLAMILGLGALDRPSISSDTRPVFWKVMEPAADEADLRKDFDVVVKHMADIETTRSDVDNRISRVRKALTQPWNPPELADELRQLLSQLARLDKGPRFESLLAGVADWLDIEDYEDPSADALHGGLQELDALWQERQDEELRGLDLLEGMSAYLEFANSLLEETAPAVNSRPY